MFAKQSVAGLLKSQVPVHGWKIVTEDEERLAL